MAGGAGRPPSWSNPYSPSVIRGSGTCGTGTGRKPHSRAAPWTRPATCNLPWSSSGRHAAWAPTTISITSERGGCGGTAPCRSSPRVKVRGALVVVVLGLLGGGCGRRETEAGPAGAPATFGLGRPATADEIKAWDIDVMADGTGLPPGSGSPVQGAVLYERKCAACHGKTGTEGPADRLVAREPRQGFPFGRDPTLVKTIGNYWPYATTLYDYINRAMPLNTPGSLAPDEVYSLVAFLLWRNEIIASTAVLNAQTLPRVLMPAHDRFVLDNRRGGLEIR